MVVATLNNIGAKCFRNGEIEESRKCFSKAITVMRSVVVDAIPSEELGAETVETLSIDKKLFAQRREQEETRSNNSSIPWLHLYEEQNLEETLRHLLDPIMLNENSERTDHHFISSVLFHNKALVHIHQHQNDNALCLLQLSLAETARASDIETRHSLLISSVYRNMAMILFLKGRYKDAIKHYEMSIHFDTEQYQGLKDLSLPSGESVQQIEDIHRRIASSVSWVGHIYFVLGEHKKAQDYCSKSLDFQMKFLEYSHLEIAATFYNFGKILQDQGDLDDALAYCTWFVQKGTNILGELHPQVLLALNNVGDIQFRSGHLRDAVKTFVRCLKCRELENGGIAHRSIAMVLLKIGQAEQEMGLYSDAIRKYTNALKILSELPCSSLKDKALILWNMGQTHHSQGDSDAALEAFKHILSLINQVKIDEESHARLLITIGNLHLEHQEISSAMSSFAAAGRVMSHSHTRLTDPSHFAVSRLMLSLVFRDMISTAAAA